MPKSIVYVVPIIDTEGPTMGRDDLFDSWQSVGEAMQKLMVETRSRFYDSFGGPMKYSWFLLDWIGYSSTDSEFRRRGHDSRLHAVWNFYRAGILSDTELSRSGDGIYWHYHHPPKNGSWGWNSDWHDSAWHEYILGKRMLDFGFFPAVYRAGKYVETNDNSRWLEQWIPFDFSNISPVKQAFCDWSRSPTNWQPYHPSFADYQEPGDMRRSVFRSLPVAAKGGSGSLKEEEVEKAFREAKEFGTSLLSFHSHDFYKSIFDDFSTGCDMVERISRAYGIRWKFSNALEAIRVYAEPVLGGIFLRLDRERSRIAISASHDIFGATPFVAVEYKDGRVRREDVWPRESGGWEFVLPENASRLAAGAADTYGNTHVVNLNAL